MRTQLGASGQFNERTKWKATVRVDVDPVYYFSNFYPEPVKQDQRFNAMVRETYIDTTRRAGTCASAVRTSSGARSSVYSSATWFPRRDERDFILPQFDIIRIPQWAARGEYFAGDSHLELVWIPYPSYNDIGKPGAEFFPVQLPPPPGFSQTFLGERIPDRNLSNTNYGLRLSTLKGGWDLSGFYYASLDATPTFYRTVIPGPTATLQYQPVHDRIWQAGATLGKASVVCVQDRRRIHLGRNYNVFTLAHPTGVVPQNTLDYIFSFDFTLPRETRSQCAVLSETFLHYDSNLIWTSSNSGVSVLLRGKLGLQVGARILVIQGLNPSNNLIRPRLTYHPARNWRASLGVDIFNGPVTHLLWPLQRSRSGLRRSPIRLLSHSIRDSRVGPPASVVAMSSAYPVRASLPPSCDVALPGAAPRLSCRVRGYDPGHACGDTATARWNRHCDVSWNDRVLVARDAGPRPLASRPATLSGKGGGAPLASALWRRRGRAASRLRVFPVELRNMRENTIRARIGHIQVMRHGYLASGTAEPFAFLIPEISEDRKRLEAFSQVDTSRRGLYLAD